LSGAGERNPEKRPDDAADLGPGGDADGDRERRELDERGPIDGRARRENPVTQ
jgi:hypothetical protein